MVPNSRISSGFSVRVRARARARREHVTEVATHVFDISVRESRTENRANDRIRAILAERFKVPLARVRVLTGHRSASKLIHIIA